MASGTPAVTSTVAVLASVGTAVAVGEGRGVAVAVGVAVRRGPRGVTIKFCSVASGPSVTTAAA
jgi:hypothetical protein